LLEHYSIYSTNPQITNKMESIVAKGSNYSFNNIKFLKESNKEKDCGLTLVYPAGETKFIHCNYYELVELTENWNKTIIYHDSYE
jgi:hypothetical protein